MSTYLNTLEATGMQLRAIVAELDDTFPPTNPGPGETISTIMYRSGQRSVVEWIINKLEEAHV